MKGRIEPGQLCTVVPADPATIAIGDIVLCTVAGHQYLHLVKAIEPGRFQIGNNRGFINGWIGPEDLHGRCIAVEPLPLSGDG
jgi:hypothetical protein